MSMGPFYLCTLLFSFRVYCEVGDSVSLKKIVYKHGVESRNIHFTLLVYYTYYNR
jgi:hypothetical protein